MFVLLASAAWVLSCSIWNIFEPRIPNWLTSLGLFLALLFRWYDWIPTGIVQHQLIIILVVWTAVFLLWRIRWIGGGDAKFVAATVLAFPDWLMVTCLMIADIIGMVLFLIRRDRLNWKSIRIRISGNLDGLPDSQDRLRATTFLGLGWIAWAVYSMTI